jgi:tRNA (guanine37-N1)-methyltransferase
VLLNVSGISRALWAVGHCLAKNLKDILSRVLSPSEAEHISSSYDIVGDIAIIRLTDGSRKYRRNIAAATMSVHRNVKTVLAQAGAVHGDFRIRGFEHVAGEKRTATTHIESGCAFAVDVSKCYFSPRLAYERMRIAKQVQDGEVVVNMFAGVGCFSLLIARYSNASKVYSIDVNPDALRFMQKNIRVNGAFGKVIPMFGDAKEVIEARLRHVGDRVLMPLPEKAYGYLSYALLALKKAGGWIHYYDFEHSRKGEDPVDKVRLKVAQKLADLHVAFEFPFGRVVRSTGPNWYQVALDIAVEG